MGGSMEIDKKYWGIKDFKENHINLSEILKTIYTADEDERIPLGHLSNNLNDKFYTEALSEFKPILKPGDIIEAKRIVRKGDDNICCLHDMRYYWKDSSNNISLNSDIRNKLYTCHIDSSKIGNATLCDNVMYNNCVELGKNGDDIFKRCKIWFSGIMRRKGISERLIMKLNNEMTTKCINNLNNIYCKEWIEGIRMAKDEELDSIVDNVLKQQPKKIKYKKLKCAFPPDYIIKKEGELYTAKECWYKECVLSESWLLLSDNIRKQNLCQLYDCAINIRELNALNSSEISIICKNKYKESSINNKKNKLDKETDSNIFLLTNYHFIVIMISLLLLYLFVDK